MAQIESIRGVAAEQQRARKEHGGDAARPRDQRQGPLGVATVARDDHGGRLDRVHRAKGGRLSEECGEETPRDRIAQERPRDVSQLDTVPRQPCPEAGVALDAAPEITKDGTIGLDERRRVSRREVVEENARRHALLAQGGETHARLGIRVGCDDMRFGARRAYGVGQRIDDVVVPWPARHEQHPLAGGQPSRRHPGSGTLEQGTQSEPLFSRRERRVDPSVDPGPHEAARGNLDGPPLPLRHASRETLGDRRARQQNDALGLRIVADLLDRRQRLRDLQPQDDPAADRQDVRQPDPVVVERQLSPVFGPHCRLEVIGDVSDGLGRHLEGLVVEIAERDRRRERFGVDELPRREHRHLALARDARDHRAQLPAESRDVSPVERADPRTTELSDGARRVGDQEDADHLKPRAVGPARRPPSRPQGRPRAPRRRPRRRRACRSSRPAGSRRPRR